MTVHEYAPFVAMGVIGAIVSFALYLGAADGLVAAALTALAALGVAGYGRREVRTP